MQNKDKINTPGTDYTNAAKPGTVVALGMFDGMHVGHKKIIDATVLIARQSGLVPAVFTFKNHPQELFGKKVLRLCSNETRFFAASPSLHSAFWACLSFKSGWGMNHRQDIGAAKCYQGNMRPLAVTVFASKLRRSC